MKLKMFALSLGVSYGRTVRACHKLGIDLDGPKRLGGTDITPEEQAMLKTFFEGKEGYQRTTVDPAKQYHASRVGWLETYLGAVKSKTADTEGTHVNLAIYGLISLAVSRPVLDTPVDGARLGDMALELCFSAGVDYKRDEPDLLNWTGFTAYLLAEGFESPGWGIW